MAASKVGTMGWLDLTVDNADEVKAFYQQVVGWTSADVSMGEYNDYMMKAENGNETAGICHNRDANKGLPAKWLPYFIIADIKSSLTSVTNLGGKQLSEIRSYGDSRFVIIKDPAGAVCALYQE
ncbi:VOC family protein [Alteromonas sp. ASW11-36]|uniref:VOC family protein n=1 Tax=Alteromonas arenosi TaxID=3055817 RepID=A0ABT7SXC4_9ALTE|nr:VOC family protein [Alteromonas sp. ASW11-36]MDM7860846.1 VOC family protein [Alteromonas sp. ASW11-36]